MTKIGNYAFYGCTSLTIIMVLPLNPPSGGYYMFDETNDAPIRVPTTSVETYKEKAFWKDYAARIQAISE